MLSIIPRPGLIFAEFAITPVCVLSRPLELKYDLAFKKARFVLLIFHIKYQQIKNSFLTAVIKTI